MKKYILYLLISVFIGIVSNPEMLSASNTVEVNGINNNKIVETVIPETTVSTNYSTLTSVSTYVETPQVATYVAPAVTNYNVTVHTDSVVVNPSYSDIYKTGKLVYAHNSANLFGNLKYMDLGETFTITENGVTTTYKVTDIVVYENTENGLNDNKYLMGRIKNTALGHSIALMTCHGTMLGNGQATHRLVIYADAI